VRRKVGRALDVAQCDCAYIFVREKSEARQKENERKRTKSQRASEEF
jgi:hypothetical protein